MPTSAIKDLLKKWEDVRAMVLEWHPYQADVSSPAQFISRSKSDFLASYLISNQCYVLKCRQLSLKKDELLLVAEELVLDIPQNPKIIVLKNLIESSEIFETDKEFLQSVIDGVLAKKAAKIEQEKCKLESEKAKIEFEKIKLEQLKKELELTNAKCKLSPAQEKSEHFESVPSDIENLIKSIKTLTIPVPSNTEAYNLFFQSLEKAFKTKNVEDKFKAEILLNMLGEKVGNLMIYVKQEELGDYEKSSS
ncbi:DUF1758 domain-containing protein [Trichonephila clavipes]|nr:DUF1758 domain-containing protein [Trichonephila clavipes]